MSESINFDRAASFYDETRGFPPGEEIHATDFIAHTAQLTPARRVLEIGVGTGRIALPLSRHTGPYFGVDISTNMMGRLKEKDNGSIRLAQADITRLPFPVASFDAVVAVHIFHLVPGWQMAVDEVRRVLNDGGMLLVCGNGKTEANALDNLYTVWNEATRNETTGSEPQRSGAWTPNLISYLLENGWERVTEQATYMYPVTEQPSHMLRLMEMRSSSSTWHLSDEVMERGLSAVRAAIAQQFDDPEAPVTTRRAFYVDVFRPV